MTILAIDPGVSTGVAIHTDSHIATYKDPPTDFLHETLVPAEYLALVVTEPTKLWDLIQTHHPTTIVVENFAAGGLISKDGQATIRLVGAMELAAYITGADFVLQYPSEIHNSTVWMDKARAMLKQRGGRAPIVHEVDAMAHLLLYEHRLAHGINVKGRRSFANTTKVR